MLGLEGRGPTSLEARYDRLIHALDRANLGWELQADAGRCADLQEAASIVFDLLYDLDYEKGGELVPRLAGVYGYLADELLSIGRTHDRARLADVRRAVRVLRGAV